MRLTIATKLFLGFLIVIGLNVLFVNVVSKLSSMNIISSILKKQHEIKNFLLQIEALHDNQERNRVIYSEIGEKNSAAAEKFQLLGAEIDSIVDSVNSNITMVVKLDSSITKEKHNHGDVITLFSIITNDIIKSHILYTGSFKEVISINEIEPVKEGIKLSKSKQKTIKDSLAAVIHQCSLKIDSSDAKFKNGIKKIYPLIENNNEKCIKEIENRIDNIKRFTLFVLLGITLFALLFAFFFSRYISNSLRRLKVAASIIAKGSFNFDHTGYPDDEIGDLAKAFFDMAYDLKKTQTELIKKRRLAAIGEIVASINHEINNPLMIISGNAQFLELIIDKGVTPDVKERIRSIIQETERISQVTKKLRNIKNPVVEDYTSTGERMINIDKSTK